MYKGERIVSSINGLGKTEYAYEKDSHWSLISYHTQKSTQSELQT